MKRRPPWLALPFLFASGCFYSFSYLDAGAGTGTSSGATSGSSSGGSSGSSSGSSGATSTAGGSTSSGGFTLSLCAPPADAGWPLSCGPVGGALTLPLPVSDLAVVPADGGFLIGMVAWTNTNTITTGAALNTLTLLPGNHWSVDPLTVTTVEALSTLSFAPAFGSGLTTMLTSIPDSSSGKNDVMSCAAPPTADGGNSFTFYDVGGNPAEVDKIRLAEGSDGTLSFVATDVAEGLAFWGQGPSGGGCPSTAVAVPSPPADSAGAWSVRDSAIVAQGAGQVAIAEVFADYADGDDVLALYSEPAGSALAATITFGTASNPHVALASDGTHLTVLASDDGSGVLFFSLDAGVLAQVAALSGVNGNELTATSCGRDCTVAGWVEESLLEDGGTEFTPKYAVVSGEGCGSVQAFPGFVAPPSPAPVSVVDPSGTVVYSFVQNLSAQPQYSLTLCGP